MEAIDEILRFLHCHPQSRRVEVETVFKKVEFRNNKAQIVQGCFGRSQPMIAEQSFRVQKDVLE